MSKTHVTPSNQANHPTQTTHHYLYDDENIIGILDANKELLASIVHDTQTDTPLSITTYDNTPKAPSKAELYYHKDLTDEERLFLKKKNKQRTYYYHRDHQGSITHLTDEEGKVVESFTYDAYGTILEHTQTQNTLNPYGYTGREFEVSVANDTGIVPDLYYYRARYYDPMQGRFISQDPIEFMAGDVNFYRYVGGDPVNWVDPFGYKKCDKADKDKRKKSLKKKGGKFQNVLEKMGAKAAKRGAAKGIIAAALAVADGPAPVGDAIALMIMATEIEALTEDVKNIQGALDDIKSEINNLIECEKESDKKDGVNVKGNKDKCKFLEGKNDCKNNPTGAYSGGKHGALKNGGKSCSPPRESHHIPADKSYPSKSKPKRDEMPAILMDKSDHAQTLSHSNGKVSQVYKGIQKKLMENNLMVVAMAMDIANIKWIADPPDKYDDAITQMLLWSACKGII